MANPVVARTLGDDHQAGFFWRMACRVFHDHTCAVRVGIELKHLIPDCQWFDDVALCYEPHVLDEFGHLVTEDYFQVKYHRSHDRAFTWASLATPGFEGATGHSILQRLRDVQVRMAPDGWGRRFHWVSTWHLDHTDDLRLFLEGNALRMDLLFSANKRAAAIRSVWREHLGVDDAELRRVLQPFRLLHSYPGAHQILHELNQDLTSAGLKPMNENANVVVYENLIRRLMQQGRHWFTRAELRAISEAEGLWTGTGRIDVAAEQAPLLPDICNVRHGPNRLFTGREEVLERLRQAHRSGQRAAVSQAIAGLGGIGKTQIAREYLYRYGATYRVVWWVRAETRTDLVQDLASLAAKLGLPEKDDKDQAEAAEATRRWLSRQPNWLIVFDNAEAPEMLVPFIPVTRPDMNGHVLITSRNPAWRGVADTFEIKGLERDESITFLRKRIGPQHITESEADKLADVLGDLPLALEQAGAYMEATETRVADYLQLFRTHYADLMKRGKPATEYSATVATTWTLSFERVRQVCPPAGELLNLCAFLAPDAIPMTLLQEASELLEPLHVLAESPLEMGRAVEALRRYSLVSRTQEDLSVHRLVQAVTRGELGEPSGEMRREWATAAVLLVSHLCPEDSANVANWPLLAKLAAHARIAVDHAEEAGAVPEACVALLSHLGDYLIRRVHLSDARSVLEKAFRMAESIHGPDSPRMAVHHHSLGVLYGALGQLAEAIEQLEQALGKAEQESPDSKAVAMYLYDYASTLRKRGAPGDALPHAQRCLSLHQKWWGPDDREQIKVLLALGWILSDLGDLDGAESYYERALMINKTAGDIDPALSAELLNQMGHVARAKDNVQRALSLHQQALQLAEAAYGSDHPQVAGHLCSVGGILGDLGQHEAAMEHYKRALRIDEDVYGPDHDEVATDLHNLGSACLELGRSMEGLPLLQRALDIRKATFGAVHPLVSTTRVKLGHALEMLQDLNGAYRQYEEALRIDEEVYGHEHHEVAMDLYYLARAHLFSGRLDDARACANRALSINQGVFGPDHSQVGRTVHLMGIILGFMGNKRAAGVYLHRALYIMSKVFGPKHVRTRQVRKDLRWLKT